MRARQTVIRFYAVCNALIAIIGAMLLLTALQPLSLYAANPNVSISPSSVSLSASQTAQFTAKGSSGVYTWSINPAVGSISSTGLYTAPASVPSGQTVTVTAISDMNKFDTATVNLVASTSVSVSVSPSSATLGPSQTQQLSATVTGTGNTGISWSLSPTRLGSISGQGVYTAPSTITSTQTVTVTATSKADNTAWATATLTLKAAAAPAPVSVSVTPGSASLTTSQSQQFSASVSGTTNTGVTWSLSPNVGVISSNGVYTAPASISSLQNVTVTATSMADTTKSASAAVSLSPPLMTVTIGVSPLTVNLTASQTQQFSASVSGTTNTGVTWSLSPNVGTVSSSGLYTAPSSISAAQVVSVIATSVADATKFSSATITLNPPADQVTITLSPGTASLSVSQAVTLTATVAGTSNTGVTWVLAQPVGSLVTTGNTAVYTSPSAISSSQTVEVDAISLADSTKIAKAIITLVPAVIVSIAPGSVTLTPNQAQQFAATVSGTSNQSVTWSLSPAVGTLSSTGLYTAPASVTSSQSVTITAQSAADSTKLAASTITLMSGPQTLATFRLNELFGVSWPEQPIEFRYDGGQPLANTTRMIGPNGSEVPYQWVSSCSDTSATSGCIVVRSALPANANYTWSLQAGVGSTATPTNPVVVATVGNNYEITNGLTGVRIVTAPGNPSPWNRAPIQGIRLADGTWTGGGAAPNLLYTEDAGHVGDMGTLLHAPAYTVTGYTVRVVDSGPMKTVVEASYTFNRPQYWYGPITLQAPGPGHYKIRITIYANSKSVLVDEDSDMQFSYFLPIYSEVMPDTARWKGHNSLDINGQQNPLCGYDSAFSVFGATSSSPIVITGAGSLPANGERVLIDGVGGNTAANGMYWAKTAGYPAGQFGLYQDQSLITPVSGNGMYTGGGRVKPAYQGWSEADPAYDAFVDLNYSSNVVADFSCNPGSSYHKLVTNYPAAEPGASWYWEFYRAGAGNNAPVVGMFAGDFSTSWFSAIGPSMPGPYTAAAHWITGSKAAGIQVDNLLRGPDLRTVTSAHGYSVHRDWAIFVSTQSDLVSPTTHQPIQDEQNMLTGINLSRLYTYQLAFPDPATGWQWQYLSSTSANQLISWVRDGTSVCGSVSCYYNLLYQSETSVWGRSLLDMWRGNSTMSVQAALDPVISFARNLEQTLATGDNHFDNTLGYYQIGLQTSPATAVLNAILMDSNTTAAQKTTAKAALALFGSLLWDNNWYPIDNDSGESNGLSNQYQQYLQYRAQSAAAAPSDPYLAAKMPIAATYPTSELDAYFSPTGAAGGSTHYQSSFFEPLILNYLNLSRNGMLSLTDPKWTAYANWELSIQTPRDPRFGNVRKGYSNGDGNTEADVRTAMLATMLRPVNPTLAGNLMWAWKESNQPYWLTEDNQFVTTLAAIDRTIPAVAPQLGSINIPGYHTAERHSFGTPNETAVWFINGGFYSMGGHRHYDDGQVSMYAHSAPLAIDWNANLYYPQTPGRFVHNSIVFDSELTHPWNADNAGLSDASTLMQNPANTEFEAFANSTTSTGRFTAGDGTAWTRTVRTMSFNPSYPIIYVTDAFSGAGASAPKTMTWNLMATGAVATPVGTVTPTIRFSSSCQSPAAQLPSNGATYTLNAGLQRFSFTGATWPQHATGGINWDFYLAPSTSSQQFFIGNWGHGCHPGREVSEYNYANGASFSESQHILRVHDSGPFTSIILPYRKTEAPARSVTQQGCGVQIVQGSETTCFNSSSATYTNGTKNILTAYDSSAQSAFGVSVTGGTQEVVVQSNQITWTISGINAGTRSVTLPAGTWYPNTSVSQSGNTFSYTFPGGAQAAPVTIVFVQ